MKRLCRTDIRLGQPLPWTVYDGNGRLLLRAGAHIAFEHQIDRLAEQGLFIQEDGDGAAGAQEALPASVFEWLLATGWTQKQLVNELLAEPPMPDVVQRVVARAARICQVCAADPDAALASVHLDFRNPYLLAHPVHSAVLCALIAPRLEMPEAERRSTVCAALTADIGMFELPHLEKQKTALDGGQLAGVRRHVARSLEVLELAGVADPVWIAAVRHHHERWNGSGYPDGRANGNIPLAARVLAAADSYAAMIKPRPHRGAHPPIEALAELFRGMGVLYDRDVCGALVKEIGMHPPGSFVRLASGETAIVKSRRRDGCWSVHAVYGADGMPYLAPRSRDAATAEFAIVGARIQGTCRAAESIARRLWRGSEGLPQ